MLKKILSIMIISIMSFSHADIIDLNGMKDGFDINLKSDKQLTVGKNDFFIKLSKDGINISDAKVRIKFFMPEMPGMPFMEFKSNAKYVNGKYKISTNLSMSGTWQYQLEWKTLDNEKYKIRGSVNL